MIRDTRTCSPNSVYPNDHECKPSLVSELRRRNVFRVALTYEVVASLLIQVASVFVPMLDAPEWIITAFVVVLGLGFAVALL